MKPDSSEGKCGPQRPDFCESSDDCESGFVCEEAERPEGPVRRLLKKGGKGPKGPKMVCVPESRRALGKGGKKGPSCNADTPCVEGECMIKENETDGHCKIPPCTSDDDCTDGKTCMMKDGETEGRCKTPCTTDGGECAEGDVCMVKENESDGFCKHPKPQHCSEDKPCDEGFDCVEAEAPTRRMLKKGGGKGKGPKMICVESTRRVLKKGGKGPKGEPCTSDVDCTKDGEICMTKDGESDGHCKVPPCTSNDDCTEADEICMMKDGETEGRCKIPPTICSADIDCNLETGEKCMMKEEASEGICKRQHCSDEKPCDEGFECVEETRRLLKKGGKGKGPKSFCMPVRRNLGKGPKGEPCAEDSACEADEICMIKDGNSEGHCGRPPCTQDNECENGEVCNMKPGSSKGKCGPPRPDFCETSDDCEEGEVCEEAEKPEGPGRRVLKKGGKGPKGPKMVCVLPARRALKKGGKPKGPTCESDEDCTTDGETCMIKDGKDKGHCGIPPIACSTGGTECTGDDVCMVKDGEEEGICKRPRPTECTTDDDCE
eukprot:UN29804